MDALRLGSNRSAHRQKHRKHYCVSKRELSETSRQAVRPGVLFSVGTSLAFIERCSLCSRVIISTRACDALQLAVCLLV